MYKMKLLQLVLLCLTTLVVKAQLKPGFDAAEYKDLLQFSFQGFSGKVPSNTEFAYKNLFVSPEVGLRNRCEMYLRTDGVAIINLRGTVNYFESWLENFYAATTPASGNFKLTDTSSFQYQLAANNKATVHVGWLTGLGYMAPYITHCIDSLYQQGVRAIIVSGHSQGGALSFLCTSYLYYHYLAKGFNIQFKTYASAAPKPGNQYYAYDFDFITRNGYAFRVVNNADWVPESPLSTQMSIDFNEGSPFKNVTQLIGQQNWLVKTYVKHMYGKLKRPPERSAKRYRKYLGVKLQKIIRKTLPQYQPPPLVKGSNYATAGTPVILATNAAYEAKFVFTGNNLFVHHSKEAYLFLLDQWYNNNSK
jgi:hypothetical protein